MHLVGFVFFAIIAIDIAIEEIVKDWLEITK